jgi:hypothetical protein
MMPGVPSVLLRQEGDPCRVIQAASLLNQLALTWKFDLHLGAMPAGRQADAVFCVHDNADGFGGHPLPDDLGQLGIPRAKDFFLNIEGAIFFRRGLGHFGFDRCAAIRLDDYPLTSEAWLLSGRRRKEPDILRELQRIQPAGSDVKITCMVNSHILDADARLKRIDELVPACLSFLRARMRKARMEVGAHGRSHIDEGAFLAERRISPLEFATINEKETHEHLKECSSFIGEYFGKKPDGFVAPCWGYRDGLTKKAAAEYFGWIADSNQRFQQGKAEPCGWVDGQGAVHLTETVRATSSEVDLSRDEPWMLYFDAGLPVHFVIHGPYMRDPLAILTKHEKTIGLGLFVAFGALIGMTARTNLLTSAVGLTALLASVLLLNARRAWLGGLIREMLVRVSPLKRCSVRSIYSAGARNGARWMFLGEMSSLLKAYRGLSVVASGADGNTRWIQLSAACDLPEGVAYFCPQRVAHALLDGRSLPVRGNRLSLGTIAKGEHRLQYVLY